VANGGGEAVAEAVMAIILPANANPAGRVSLLSVALRISVTVVAAVSRSILPAVAHLER
jgi:hypothetical protein